MNLENKKSFLRLPSNKIILSSLFLFILLMLAITCQISYTILVYDKIYKGVYINDFHAGGYTKAELEDTLKRNYTDKAAKIELTLAAKGHTEKLSFSNIDLDYDIKGTINKAYKIGRSGNIITKLNEIYKSSKEGIKIDLPSTYNKGKVESIINSLHSKILIPVKEADLSIQGERVTVRTGRSGDSIDKNKVFKDIEDSIKNIRGGTLEIAVIKTPPAKINVDEYYGKINSDFKDATFRVENNKLNIVPEVMGRSIDKSVLASIISELEIREDTEKVMPVVFTKPKVTTDMLKARLFSDTLATMNTQFYTGSQNDANRGENIRIASAKINGLILAPGEVFSFNDVVGPRTEEGGYKVAHAYSGGKIIDDVGGGICQVSTTLYNAVLFADLEVNERVNHMFTVGYIPKGRDAAVSYDSVDLKFTNSTNWPIKIQSWVTNDNRIYFSIKGSSDTPSKTVEINSEIVKTLDFETRYVDDPSLPVWETAVRSEGMTGYIVDTYKIVKQDGKIISENKIHRSVYNPLHREIVRGTKKQQ